MELRPVTIYEFETGHLRGYLQGLGSSPGIHITSAGERGRLTSSDGAIMSLTHYLSDAQVGPKAPLNIPGRSEEMSDDCLSVRFPPVSAWPVDALVSFCGSDEGCIDITLHFHFRQAIEGFEAQVISSFAEDVPAAHVHVGGDWFRPALKSKDICFFSRDEPAAAMIQSGRWDFHLARGYNVILDDRGYDYPLLAYLDEKSGWALVQMLITDECPSLSLCSSPVQYNFSLVGRSVKAKEEVSCHARMIYGKLR
ncbi:MAG: hypothetical protein GTN69_13335, partial [Armatimonadetes bacterium]|nr:hypothetical protein [Armatimonadota bacterium]NIO76825.1 hypothetical protein [Armatimonadota bacterium]NIO99020.1 hypothetical protein [Armatimonadota bacterium]